MQDEADQIHDRAYVYGLTDEEAYLQSGKDEKPAIAAEPMPDWSAPRVCSFCDRAAEHLFGQRYPKMDNTGTIVDGVWICDACVARFVRFLLQENPGFLDEESPGIPS